MPFRLISQFSGTHQKVRRDTVDIKEVRWKQNGRSGTAEHKLQERIQQKSGGNRAGNMNHRESKAHATFGKQSYCRRRGDGEVLKKQNSGRSVMETKLSKNDEDTTAGSKAANTIICSRARPNR